MGARSRIYNSFDAHRLLHLAGTLDAGLQRRLKGELFKAYFSEGRNISDPAELLAVAAVAGMPPVETRAVLEATATPTMCAPPSRSGSAWASARCRRSSWTSACWCRVASRWTCSSRRCVRRCRRRQAAPELRESRPAQPAPAGFPFLGPPRRAAVLEICYVFKNLIIYRIGEGWQADADAVEAELAKTPFQPANPPSPSPSAGRRRGCRAWPPRRVVDGHWLLKLQREQRLLPGSVVTERVDELAEQIEHQTGRKPGKKARKDLKEQAAHELLPRAFTKTGATRVWMAPAQRLLLVDAGSVARADEVTRC
jgi:hypothetical protein